MEGLGIAAVIIPLLKGAVLFFGIILAGSLLTLAYRILRADPGEWELNRERYRSWKDPFMGKAHALRSGRRDFRVRAGLAVRNNTWEEQGILSDEAVDAVLQAGVRLKDVA